MLAAHIHAGEIQGELSKYRKRSFELVRCYQNTIDLLIHTPYYITKLGVESDGAEEFVELVFEEDAVGAENGGFVADFEDDDVAV